MTPQAFGEYLKRRREKRKITLETIAHATKVRASLFAALERGDCSRWPGGVYNRGYVRAYAAVIGLDPDEIAEQYSECFPDPLRISAVPVAPEEPPPGRWSRWWLALSASWRSMSAERR